MPPPHHAAGPPPPYGHRRGSPPRGHHVRAPVRNSAHRLEPNATGGVSLVAERVPPSLNNMDVLNEYFGTYGPVVNLQINHARHEAIITFSRVENAEEAMRWPVLNDPSVGLRPWRGKAGQRGPHEVPQWDAPAALPAAAPTATLATAAAAPAATLAAAPPATATAPAADVAASERATDGKDEVLAATAGAQVPAAPAWAQATPPPAFDRSGGNLILRKDDAARTAVKTQKQEMEDKRKKLLQCLTDQLKVVMGRISDPRMSEGNREKLQMILNSIKEKITNLTPKKPDPPPLPVAPPSRREPVKYGRHSVVFNQGRTGGGPAQLRLTGLPVELRGDEARLRQALGEGTGSIRQWNEDGSACVVYFAQRQLAKAASRAHKVWGFEAEVVAVPGKRFQPALQDEEDAMSSETEAMETDIEEEDEPEAFAGSVVAEGDVAAAPPMEAAPAAPALVAEVAAPIATEAAVDEPMASLAPAAAEAAPEATTVGAAGSPPAEATVAAYAAAEAAAPAAAAEAEMPVPVAESTEAAEPVAAKTVAAAPAELAAEVAQAPEASADASADVAIEGDAAEAQADEAMAEEDASGLTELSAKANAKAGPVKAKAKADAKVAAKAKVKGKAKAKAT